LTFGPDGNLYVTGASNQEVRRYNGATGAFIDAFVSASSGGLADPNGLVFGPDGNLYVGSVAPDEIPRYDGTTGAFIDAFVPSGSGGLNAPFDLTFGPDGNLYVDSVSPDRILRFDGTTGASLGAFVTAADNGGLNGPGGLSFGPDGNLYVTSLGTAEVLRYHGATGDFIDVFVTAASGGLDIPTRHVFGPAAPLPICDVQVAANDMDFGSGIPGDTIVGFFDLEQFGTGISDLSITGDHWNTNPGAIKLIDQSHTSYQVTPAGIGPTSFDGTLQTLGTIAPGNTEKIDLDTDMVLEVSQEFYVGDGTLDLIVTENSCN